MATLLVDRATSDMLIGTDWSINMEICDVLNADTGQAKETVKLLKKRIISKNSNVQLLTLTLLETLIKNCGDAVHMHVAEKGILHEMVKIVKKRHDFHVKEKILVLIDTWQEAFGGPRARFPQYYAAYQELLNAGVVFPQRSETSVPIFTPPQTQPLSSYARPVHRPDLLSEKPESSLRSDLPSLSPAEIQNARGVADVLYEMLSAMDPSNKEDLKQEVIVDLVEQCRSYKQRVIQFINSTSDERLLSQSLALNDDLQRALALRDAIASGIAVKKEKQKPIANITKPDIKVSDTATEPINKISTTSTPSTQSSVSPSVPLGLGTPTSNGKVTPPARVPQIDLLSGDFNPPENENPLALVPVNVYAATSTFDQNASSLPDIFGQNSVVDNQPPSPSHSPYPVQQAYNTPSNAQIRQSMKLDSQFSFNGANSAIPQIQQAYLVQANQLDMTNHAGNAQRWNMQKSLSFDSGNNLSGGALPPPPWELQQSEGIAPGPARYLQAQSTNIGGINPQRLPQIPQYSGGYSTISDLQSVSAIPYQTLGGPMLGLQMQPNQTATGGSYIFFPPMNAPYYGQTLSQYPYPYSAANNLSQRMYGVHLQDNSSPKNVSPTYRAPTLSSSPSLKQPARPSRPEDKLFGDLVDFSKLKLNKPAK